ncbi:hydrolase [Nocardioidaceae bacterium]|nr:hydrolase [Nocardioidaceae bacterium]
MSEVLEVDTPRGPARLHVDAARGAERARLLMGHGAGGGVEAPDLAVLAERLPATGVTVLRLEQPWRVAGRRVAGNPASLDEALRAVLATLWMQPGGTSSPLVLGGRSAGARSACRVAATVDADGPAGVVVLAFPLHPPGRPERSRAGELLAVGAGTPLVVVQGERDSFGGPAEIEGVLASRDPVTDFGEVVGIPLADHSFAVPRRAGAAAGTSTEQALDQVAAAVGRAVDRIAGERGTE